MKRNVHSLASAVLVFGLSLANLAPASAQVDAEPARPAAGAAPAGVAAPPAVNDPRIDALLATNPTSPEDLFAVSMLLVDLKYPQIAKQLFDKLVETAVEEPQLAALGRKVGITQLYRLAEVKEFRPQAGEFIQRVVAATDKANRDPTRLAELIEQLKTNDLGAQAAAVVALRTGGDAAAQALVDVLVDPARSAEHRTVATALAGLGAAGLAPLGELAQHGDEAQRRLVLDVLGYVEDRSVEPTLVAAAFGPATPPAVRAAAEAALMRHGGKLPKPVEAAAALYLEAKRTYLKQPPQAERNAQSAVWRWDAAAKRPVSSVVVKRAADLDRASRLAAQASEISGNDADAQLLALAASLEGVLAAAGDDAAARQSAASQWAAAGKPDAVQLGRLLDLSMTERHFVTAAAVAHLLGAAAGEKALESSGGRPAILVRALQSPDRRLRFAALEEIVRLNPQTPFVGSSAVADALGYFASSSGARKALVVDKNPARGRDVAGIVAALGYQAEAVLDARTAVATIADRADYELVLMYRPFLDPVFGQLYAQLRADPRTAQLPLAVYCEPDDVEPARSTLRSDLLAAVIYEPRLPETLASQLSELLPAAAAVQPPAAERLAQAQFALTAIGRLTASGNRVINTRQFEPVLLNAAWDPAVGAQALAALGSLGSAAAQRTLTDVAGAGALPLELRQAAAKAFCESVIRYNILLTKGEVLRQYDRYNASASADRPTQQLLGAILDAIEKRNAPLEAGSAQAVAAPVPASPAPAAASGVAPAPEAVPTANP